MPEVDVVQETFVAAAPELVAAALADPAVPAEVWPGLTVTVTQRRGREGQRYAVDGAWRGTAELWLEAYADGVVVHAFLRVDPVRGTGSARARARLERTMRRAVMRYKDRIEAGREPGTAAVGTMAAANAR